MLGKRPFKCLHCCRSFKYKAGLDLHNEFEDHKSPVACGGKRKNTRGKRENSGGKRENAIRIILLKCMHFK